MPTEGPGLYSALALLAIMQIFWYARQPSTSTEPQIRVDQLEIWMLESLPGIGAQSAAGWQQRIQQEGIEVLPAGPQAILRPLLKVDTPAQESPDNSAQSSRAP